MPKHKRRRLAGIRRSFLDFKRHPWLHLMSVGTITIALVFLGFYFLCYRNLTYLADKTTPKTAGTIYLKEGQEVASVEYVRQKLYTLEIVEAVEFRPRTSILSDLRGFLGGEGGNLLSHEDLFPDVLEVKLRKGTDKGAIAALTLLIRDLPGVADVDFSQDWLQRYEKIRQILKVVGIILFVGILFGCSFMIANFMAVRHQSRRKEIDTVRLIGANTRYLLTPFIWEGLIEGTLGATIALGGIYLLKSVFTILMSAEWVSVFGMEEWLYLSPLQSSFVFLVGIAMAFIGTLSLFFRIREER